MSIHKRKKFGKCVYCGVRDGDEREHVIATCFFDKPYPPEIPKLPACGKCNRGKGDGGSTNLSDDEAYVRDRILMQIGMDEHPVAARLLQDKVFRNFSRPESRRQREELVASMRPGVASLGPGQYLHGAWSFKIDLKRFERVMSKMVRGLYAHHMAGRMPDDYGVVVVPRMDQRMYDWSRTWIMANDPSPLHRLGEADTVTYQFASRSPSPLGNNWIITFYGRFSFYAHTGPKVPGVDDFGGD